MHIKTNKLIYKNTFKLTNKHMDNMFKNKWIYKQHNKTGIKHILI